MNRANLLHKIMISAAALLLSALLYGGGVYAALRGIAVKGVTDALIVLLCGLFAASLLVYMRRKELPPPKMPIRRLMSICRIVAVLEFALLLVTLFFCGLSYRELPLIHLLFAIFSVYMIGRFLIAATIRLEASTDCAELGEESCLTLFQIARRAAGAVGLTSPSALYSQIAAAPAALSVEGELRIIIGSHIPSLLSEYELEAMLIAELGLIRGGSESVNVSLKKRAAHWQVALEGSRSLFPNFFLVLPFRMIDSALTEALRRAEQTDEQLRIDAVMHFGIPSDYANAVAKLTAYQLYLKHPSVPNLFETEEPPRDPEERLLEAYRRIGHPLLRRAGRSAVLNTTEGGFRMPLAEKLRLLRLDDFSLDAQPISDS